MNCLMMGKQTFFVEMYSSRKFLNNRLFLPFIFTNELALNGGVGGGGEYFFVEPNEQ